MVKPTYLARIWITGFLLAGAFALPAQAFMRWNEGTDTIFVNVSAGWLYDSNIYTDTRQISDNSWRAYIGGEYRRHAGLIGVNIDVGTSIAVFRENTDLDFSDPNFRIELTKDTGRTTGTVAASYFRSSRADPTINARTKSENLSTELRLRYPVSNRHSISASIDWLRQDYDNNDLFVDIDTTTLATDWYYIYTAERDLFGGYRIRFNETSLGDEYLDHSISGGVSGRIIKGLNGSARLGYQTRSNTNGDELDYSGFNASLSGTWNFAKSVAMTATVSQDLNVTATNVSTDELRANLDLQYARNAKLLFAGGLGVGRTQFISRDADDREDTYLTYYGRIQYSFSEKLRIAVSYTYFENWSSDPIADFDRESITFDVSSRF